MISSTYAQAKAGASQGHDTLVVQVKQDADKNNPKKVKTSLKALCMYPTKRDSLEAISTCE